MNRFPRGPVYCLATRNNVGSLMRDGLAKVIRFIGKERQRELDLYRLMSRISEYCRATCPRHTCGHAYGDGAENRVAVGELDQDSPSLALDLLFASHDT